MNPHDSHSHPEKPAGDMIPAKTHPVPAPIPATGSNSSDLTMPVLTNAISRVEESLVDFQHLLEMDATLTGQQRKRLISARSRNYGFISQAFIIALKNPEFRPPNFNFETMTENIEVLDEVRQLALLLADLQALVNDLLLQSCDTSYRDALRVYGNLQAQDRANVPVAGSLFAELQQFFTLHRTGAGAELTEKQLEADIRRLLHGHADGEIVIKHESPHKTGGAHEVVDEVHKHGHGGAKIEVKE